MSMHIHVTKRPAVSLMPGTPVPGAVGTASGRGKAMAVESPAGFPSWPLNVGSRLTLHRPDEPRVYRSAFRAVRTLGGGQGNELPPITLSRRTKPLPCLQYPWWGSGFCPGAGNPTMGQRGDAV